MGWLASLHSLVVVSQDDPRYSRIGGFCFGDPLTKMHKRMRIFRKLGSERSEVTSGEIAQDAKGHKPAVRRSMSQKRPGAIPGTPRLTLSG